MEKSDKYYSGQVVEMGGMDFREEDYRAKLPFHHII